MIRAIIAEDDEANLELLAELLEIYGLEILDKVTNGQKAVKAFELHRPDVIFLDVMMPEFDGLYALEHIRKISPFANVIMITADVSDETQNLFDKLQPSAIIHKPYDISTIIHILEQKLELKIKSKE